MAQAPAVVIVARHGLRLDAADSQWRLSTPSPYDPPLTYAGWNQCRALGLRIANLLHAREQKLSTPGEADGVTSQDFATVNANGKRGAGDAEQEGGKRKRRRVVKHKVVIHTSPFLRCLQTSTAIAAGLAQCSPSIETGGGGGGKKSAVESRSRSPNPLGIASPRLRAADGGGVSPKLTPIPEPKHDLAHEVARRALQERKRFRRSKLRVDAFLGEWLTPQYFEDITPPPPSSMMIKTAKGELMQNEMVEVFTPTTTSSAKATGNGSLWSRHTRKQSLEEWSQIQDSLPAPTVVRESRSRASTVGSETGSTGESGRKSPFGPGSSLSPLMSMMPKPELSVYNPPTPQYAVSGSDQIPRGYVAHARNACTNVDFQWDSSRPPQDWGDGGELGEEWSAMHKRFRKGLGSLVDWYSRHGADDRGEDALGLEQAEQHKTDGQGGEEEEEDLVVVMVTHGAGCNALIGALTGQPVLLDVGMGSLTMAVRKDDAAPLPASTPNNSGSYNPDPQHRRSTTDLSYLYDMHLVASTEHLRPPSNLSSRAPSSTRPTDLASFRESFRTFSSGSGSSIDSQPLSFYETPRSTGSTSALLGSIRRPSAAPLSAPGSSLPSRMNSSYLNIGATGRGSDEGDARPPVSQGLWTPPASRTPLLRPQAQPPGGTSAGNMAPRSSNLSSSNSPLALLGDIRSSDGDEDGALPLLDFSTSPPDSRPGTSSGYRSGSKTKQQGSINGTLSRSGNEGVGKSDQLPTTPKAGAGLPEALSTGGQEHGMKRPVSPTMKRRWTVDKH